MKFSERLADLMAENGLNKLSFAKKIGVSDRVVGSWVKEENAPKLESAIVVAEYFGVSLDYLSGRSDVREIGTKKDPALEISENGYPRTGARCWSYTNSSQSESSWR